MNERLRTECGFKFGCGAAPWRAMATVARRGDAVAGALFLKVNRFAAGCEVFSGTSNASGEQAWLRATGPTPVREGDADAYLARQIRYDADLWILEIEDPKGVFRLDEPIIGD